VTERAAFRLVLEQRNGHLNDHALTRCYASTITAAGSEPGPGGVGPGTGLRAGRTDRGSGGQGQHRVGLGNCGPDGGGGLAVSLAEQFVRLSGKFPGRGGNALVRSLTLPRVSSGSGSDTTHAAR